MNTKHTPAPQGMSDIDWYRSEYKGEHEGYSIYKAERASTQATLSYDLVSWFAVKDNKVSGYHTTRKGLFALMHVRDNMTDHQRAMKAIIDASLNAEREAKTKA